MQRTWVAALVMAGSACFFLVFLLLFANSNEVQCDQRGDQTYHCEVRTRLLDQVQISARDVDGVVDIVVAEDSCDDGCAYRAEFVTRSGNHEPLSIVYTDHEPVARQVAAIGEKLARGEPRITYKVGVPLWILFLLGALLILDAVVVVAILPRWRGSAAAGSTGG